MGTKNSVATSTQQLPGYINDAYKNLIGSAGQTAGSTFTPYTGGFTQDQQTAFQNIGSLWGQSQPQFGAANDAYNASMVPTSDRVQQYMSPYMDSVVSSAMANMQEQNAQQQQGVVGNAITKGALGGNRVGVAQAELGRQQKLADNAAIANLLQSGYGTALGAAQADKAAQLQAAQGYAGLGQTQMQTNLAQAASQLGAGTQQQEFDYQQYLNKLAFPYQQQGWLASIVGGLGSTAGGTTTEKKPAGNLFSQILGTGLQVAGLFSDERMKEGVVPIGKSFDGQPIYSYRYKGRPETHLGMLAQEVQRKHPDAVGQSGGMLTVDYDRATREAADKGEFAMGGVVRTGYAVGGVPYANDNGSFPGYSSMFGSSPYANDNGSFGGYIPQVQIAGGGGNFPTISPDEEQADPFADPNGMMKKGASNLKSLFGGVDASKVRMPALFADGGVVGRRGYAAGGSPFDPFAPYPINRRPVVDELPAGIVPKIEALEAPAPTAAPFPMAYPDEPGGVVPLERPKPLAPGPVDLGIIRGGNPDREPLPRSIRNNNPGNLVDSAWTRKQPGYAGTDGRFARFETADAGRAAQLGLLDNYAGRGYDTISAIVNRWAPPSDNNPTGGYIDYVVRRTGLSPNQPLDAAGRAAVADAMAEFEGGTQAKGFSRTSEPLDVGSEAGVVPFERGGQFVTNPRGDGYSQNGMEALQSLFAGKGLNVAPDVQNALITAGGAMAASRSPFFLQGVGEGTLAGTKAWQEYQGMERENALARNTMGTSGQQLALQAEQTAAEVARAKAEAARIETETQANRYDYHYTPYGIQVTDKVSGTPGPIYPYGSMMPDGQIAEKPEDAPLFSTEPSTVLDPRLNSDVGASQAIGMATEALKVAQTEASSSQSTQQLLQDMKHNLAKLPAEGLMTPGKDFPERAEFAKGINTYAQVLGLPTYFPKEEIAAAEDLNKLTTRLGFDLSRMLGTGEAASVIMNSIAAVPGGANSKQGAERIIAGLEAANRRRIDYANALQKWTAANGGSNLGFDEYFNKSNPPELYALSSYVPIEAMQLLAKDPSQEAIAEFNEAFGDGKNVAKYVLRR